MPGISTIGMETPLIRLLGGMPLYSSCRVANNGLSFHLDSLVDTGANGYLFIDEKVADFLVANMGYKQKTNFEPYVIGTFEDGTS